MHRLFSNLRRQLAAATLLLAATLPAAADPVSYFVPYSGQGNVAVFDAVAGTGGWVGSIDQFPDPGVSAPLSLVSVVLFTVDAATQTFTGSFEFTTTDLLSTLFGDISGTVSVADILDVGGQFSIDYQILGGTGLFARASGFGLAFLDFDPLATGRDNHGESGLLSFTVPEPASLALVALALMAALTLTQSSRKARRVN
jgi:hypothetical protein